MRKGYFFSVLKFVSSLLVLFGILKVITFIPTERIHPLLADKLVFLQQMEKGIEAFFSNFGQAYNTAVLQRETENKYQVLYRELQAQNTLNEAERKENIMLRASLGFKQNTPTKLLPAEIIGRSADSWFNFVLVDKGKTSGIKENQVVINQSGLVGYAYEVSEYSTKVLLITDPQAQISCINERTKEITVLRGALLRPLEMRYATVHSDIQVGDRLLTSGYSYRYRKGLLIGEVQQIDIPKNKIFKQVKVKPAVDFSKLDIVFFI